MSKYKYFMFYFKATNSKGEIGCGDYGTVSISKPTNEYVAEKLSKDGLVNISITGCDKLTKSLYNNWSK